MSRELVQKLLSIPKDEHVSMMSYCHALVVKALTRTSFGDYFKTEEVINQFRQSYNDVSFPEMYFIKIVFIVIIKV